MSRLRDARTATGLSREKVAARIGVSSKTIERWENGQPLPKRYRLKALAKVYETSVEDLLADEVPA